MFYQTSSQVQNQLYIKRLNDEVFDKFDVLSNVAVIKEIVEILQISK